VTDVGTTRFGAAVDAALDWLGATQAATGELTSFASPLGDGEPVWVPDSLKFITALGVLALDPIDDDRARRIVDRAVDFLRHERESMALWRYWSSADDQFDFTPPDVDDTACCSMAVATRGDTTRRNVAVLLANRDPAGAFLTWLVPRPGWHRPGYWWAMRDELRGQVRRRRRELWETTEAFPDDVDGVVNTNVLRYLGPRAPRAAVDHVVAIVEEGREDDCDSWHRNRYTLYASLADAHRRGVPGLERTAALVPARIRERWEGSAGIAAPLDVASALLALQTFGGPDPLRAELAAALAERQLDDGSWERSIFYYGGPDEVFGWASEALSTACASLALTREDGTP